MEEFTLKRLIINKLIEWKNYEWAIIGDEDILYVSAQLRKIIKYNFLYYLSFFLDKKLMEYETSKVIKILALLYRPIARFRVKHLFFNFMIDKRLISLFLSLVLKYKKWK